MSTAKNYHPAIIDAESMLAKRMEKTYINRSLLQQKKDFEPLNNKNINDITQQDIQLLVNERASKNSPKTEKRCRFYRHLLMRVTGLEPI